jgi:hypothetical protein
MGTGPLSVVTADGGVVGGRRPASETLMSKASKAKFAINEEPP